jgi:DNA-binding beta-propeller fold protein YncE
VAVLGVWHRRARGHPAIGIGQTGFHSAAETTSGADGRFRFPSRVMLDTPPLFPIEGPQLALFKDGYGGFKVRGGRDLTRPGVVIEMRPLATEPERISYLEGKWPRGDRDVFTGWEHARAPANPHDVPYRMAAGYEAAINLARAALGLPATGIGFPGLWTAEGTTAPADARLKQPGGIAVSGGHVYVADTHHHRIVKLARAFEPVATWGSFGRDDGQLQLPRGVAVAGEVVYVADWGNRRVQAFSTDGRFLGKWGELRYNELGGTFTPSTVAATRAPEIVVSTGIVYRFSGAGALIAKWGEASRFNQRSGIAVDGDGFVYAIAGQHSRPQVQKLDRDGVEVATWGRHGTGRGELFDPIALAVDHAGRVYVACWGGGRNARIVVFDARGAFVHQWDVASGTAPWLRMPSALAVDPQGTVYVTDLKHDRVHTLGALAR